MLLSIVEHVYIVCSSVSNKDVSSLISFIFIVHILYVYPDDLYTGVEGIKYEIIVSNNEILPLMPYKHFHFRQDDV